MLCRLFTVDKIIFFQIPLRDEKKMEKVGTAVRFFFPLVLIRFHVKKLIFRSGRKAKEMHDKGQKLDSREFITQKPCFYNSFFL